MSVETLTVRVENHERRLELLEALPARVSAVELQIRQLRTEIGEQFSATRQEFAAADSGLREEIRALGTALRAEIKARERRFGPSCAKRSEKVTRRPVGTCGSCTKRNWRVSRSSKKDCTAAANGHVNGFER